VEQWHPDILVSDIGLPGDDGYVLIQKLRQGDYGRSMPALAVTAYARAEDRARALSAGFQMHVAKPLEPADFVASIARLVSKDRGAAA
jgi:CheY-like chemotaxis protein